MSITSISRQAGSRMCTASVPGSNKRSSVVSNILKIEIQFTRTYSLFLYIFPCNTCMSCAMWRQTQARDIEAWTCIYIWGWTCSRRSAPDKLLLQPVLYLRWQRWSRSPGLIYLRGGIMNSLWHLIFPSLLIWLSAGICTAIHTAWASRLEPHTFSCFTHDRFTASHPKDANCASFTISLPSLLNLLKNNMSSITRCLEAHS